MLSGEPLFVCQYRMAAVHWHDSQARAGRLGREGGSAPLRSIKPPGAHRCRRAGSCAKPIGDGFYGVDIKQSSTGYVVAWKFNDNPNLEHGIEDAVTKDEAWIKRLRWFIDRFEQYASSRSVGR